jgi:hypothetical protein
VHARFIIFQIQVYVLCVSSIKWMSAELERRRRRFGHLPVLCVLVCLLVVGLVSASPRADGPAVRLKSLAFSPSFANVASPGALLLLAVIGLLV